MARSRIDAGSFLVVVSRSRPTSSSSMALGSRRRGAHGTHVGGRVAGGAALLEEEPVQASERGQRPRHRGGAEPRGASLGEVLLDRGHIGAVDRGAARREEGLVADEITAIGEDRVAGPALLDGQPGEVFLGGAAQHGPALGHVDRDRCHRARLRSSSAPRWHRVAPNARHRGPGGRAAAPTGSGASTSCRDAMRVSISESATSTTSMYRSSSP